MPGRVDAAALLLSLDPPPWFVRHARAVAEVAGWLAARIDARGTPVDRRLVESAALLHDADKALPPDDPARALPHGDGSAAWLTRQGHPELARAVANHPVTRMRDGERYKRWAAFASREERIVAYADRRAEQRLVSMDADSRHGGGAIHASVSMAARPPGTTRSCARSGHEPTASRPTSAVPRASHPGRPTAGLDRSGAPGRPRADTRTGRPPMTTPSLAFFWGDDELSAARALDRFEAALGAESGAPMERWLLRGNRNGATGQIADLNERVATPVMFGGGTLAVVLNAGALVVKNEDRDAMLATMTVVAPGNALVILDASQSGAKAPVPKRLAEAVAAAGGVVRQFQAPKGGGLTAWIEGEARERGLTSCPGPPSASPSGSAAIVQEADAERRHQTRIASMELDKLALYRGTAPIGPDDVTALVAEAVPGSVWAFTDAVGERRAEQALDFLDRLLDDDPGTGPPRGPPSARA